VDGFIWIHEQLSFSLTLKDKSEFPSTGNIEILLYNGNIPTFTFKLVSYVAEDGVDALKPLVMDGPVFKAAVYSKETLSCVRIDKSLYFMWWFMPHFIYYHFFTKCLEANNPHALKVILYKPIAYENFAAECYRSTLWAELFGEHER